MRRVFVSRTRVQLAVTATNDYRPTCVLQFPVTLRYVSPQAETAGNVLVSSSKPSFHWYSLALFVSIVMQSAPSIYGGGIHVRAALHAPPRRAGIYIKYLLIDDASVT